MANPKVPGNSFLWFHPDAKVTTKTWLNRTEKKGGRTWEYGVEVLEMVSFGRAMLSSLVVAIVFIAFVGASNFFTLAGEEKPLVALGRERVQELRKACGEGDQAACERLQTLRRDAILKARSLAQKNFVARGLGFAFQEGKIDHYHHLEVKIFKDIRPRNIVGRIFQILERFEGEIVSKDLIERVRRTLVEEEVFVGMLQFDEQKYQLKNMRFKDMGIEAEIYQPIGDEEQKVGHIHLLREEDIKQPISVGSMELNGINYRVFIHIEPQPILRTLTPPPS